MQKYTPLGDTATETVKQALLNHEDNINSIRSSNSGSSFPTESLVAGLQCYSTALKATYTSNGSSWDKDSDLSIDSEGYICIDYNIDTGEQK